MCANYSATRKERMSQIFNLPHAPSDEEYKEEAFPGDFAPIVRLDPLLGGQLDCRLAMFGLVPAWAEPRLARHTYNARSETVAIKPSFRRAWQHAQFCLIAVDAFYEPRYSEEGIVRCKISSRDGQALVFAGIWECHPKLNNLFSFSMLTINADAHPVMQQFHKPGEEKRMPVMLDAEQQQAWLRADSRAAAQMMLPWEADLLQVEVAPVKRRGAPRGARKPVAAPMGEQGSLF